MYDYAYTNELPDYTTDRQHRSYRKHKRLLERIVAAYECGEAIHPEVVRRLGGLIEYYGQQKYAISGHARSVANELIAASSSPQGSNIYSMEQLRAKRQIRRSKSV